MTLRGSALTSLVVMEHLCICTVVIVTQIYICDRAVLYPQIVPVSIS